MNWADVILITFSAVAVNHLGLTAAVEKTVRRRLPVINCPKCLSFWTVLAYGIACHNSQCPIVNYTLQAVAVAFLSAWSALWLDLFMGIIDKLYLFIYEQIYSATDTADPHAVGTRDTVSDMPSGESQTSR